MCIFCQIIRKEIPAAPLYEDEETLIIPDLNPQAPLHWLIMPKAHVENLTQAAPEQVAACVRAMQKLVKEKNITDYRLIVNSGAEAGQTVPHLHFHLLSGRGLGWPPG
ncbi:histidine triad family protein [Candidatus Termititenax persephonae]|uniref:Histidine triad family protein n=1 Tax=Candidatus Termititenax persephonae TaxID=2218525 RepID=A0A388TFF5_9BACT|nr:histidine triad family protein [Candidatus Termititenax persephonae]